MTPPRAGVPRRRIPYLLVAVPAGFLLAFFVIPTMLLLSASVLKSKDMVPTGELTLGNFHTLLSHRIYVDAVVRTFGIGLAVGVLVVLLGYPLAYILVRTDSRWKNVLVAMALAPLLASVIVRTYGWWVLLNRDGAINTLLHAMGDHDPSADDVALDRRHHHRPGACAAPLWRADADGVAERREPEP